MRIRTFIIAYALVLAILLFADRRPHPAEQPRYSHVVDLTEGQNTQMFTAQSSARNAGLHDDAASADSQTRIIAPDALIPGTWTAGQIPAERLIAPLVVMDIGASPAAAFQISLDEIAVWEAQHGVVPQGAIVAIRRSSATSSQPASTGQQAVGPGAPHLATLSATRPSAAFPITAEAAQFLMDARYTTGFAIEAAADLASDRALSRQIALHGNYVVEGAPHLDTLPATGSLIIVAPAKSPHAGPVPVRVLAMVR